jgi:hypothetical protein
MIIDHFPISIFDSSLIKNFSYNLEDKDKRV